MPKAPVHASHLHASRIRLLAITLLAFALTTFRLDWQSLWYDEGVTATVTQKSLPALTAWTAADIQPPLYYYTVALWGRVAGWNEWALRFPSAWATVLAVLLFATLLARLTGASSARLPGALLAALHPLLVYYGQEARMYAQLTLLGVLAGGLLIWLANRQRPSWFGWAGFVLAMTAALYTHYFALFLFGGLAIAFLVDSFCWRRSVPPVRSLWPFLAASVAIALLYIPWLSAVVTQLGQDRSYWTGTLKLDEALARTAIAFTSGETVLEQSASWLLVSYGLVTAYAVYRLWRAGKTGHRLLLYALCWLVVPVLAVLLLALVLPKFNARYALTALPGLLLIWSGGLSLGANQGPGSNRTGPRAALLLLIVSFFFSLSGWFFNPIFSKDQWRQLTEFLRPRLGPEETVVLVSGHAWPVWHYYAPDLEPLRLPDLEIIDVEAILDFDNTAPILRQTFANDSGLRGAWLVNWQDEVVDPNQIVPIQFELSGREKGQSASFQGIGLRRFTGFRASRFVDSPPLQTTTPFRFGGQVALRGYRILSNGDLLLFWERLSPASPDLHLQLSTAQADGTVLAVIPGRRLAGYTYPFTRWQPGELVTGHIPASQWLGTPEPAAGRYWLTISVFDGDDPQADPLPTHTGSPLVEIGPVEVKIE